MEEARGRTDLASARHPTLLAAEPQTVCSQQYMHLLVLFQEIISLCVCDCAWMYASVSRVSIPSQKWQTSCDEVADEQYGEVIRGYGVCASERLSVGVSAVLNVSAEETTRGRGANKHKGPDDCSSH